MKSEQQSKQENPSTTTKTKTIICLGKRYPNEQFQLNKSIKVETEIIEDLLNSYILLQDHATCETNHDKLPNGIQYLPCYDGTLLKCSFSTNELLFWSSLHDYEDEEEGGNNEDFFVENNQSFKTILGIMEQEESLQPNHQQGQGINNNMKDSFVKVYYYDQSKECTIDTNETCSCYIPNIHWARKNLSKPQSPPQHDNSKKTSTLKLYDMMNVFDSVDEKYLSMDCSNNLIFHMLRSMVTCSSCNCNDTFHINSPWCNSSNNSTCSNQEENDKTTRDYQVVKPSNYCQNCIIGLLIPNKNIDFIYNIFDFIVGNASPSFYLHSISTIYYNFLNELLDQKDLSDDRECVLFIYRHIPSRNQFYRNISGSEEKDGCLYEQIILKETQEKLYNRISPPYLSYKQEYPNINLSSLLTSSVYTIIQQEALNIPQWEEWPEKQHYNNQLNAWTVFPLCYTFPANDVAKRTWVQSTCTFVPKTVQFLKDICDANGMILRTALFSRLAPYIVLQPHTGWEALANYVLRCHIPLTHHENSECGLWVDGCIQYHHFNNNIDLQVFDDSKVHRAFNYSDEERIVLIFDLMRPEDLPRGYAVGGDTEELDGFIQEFVQKDNNMFES